MKLMMALNRALNLALLTLAGLNAFAQTPTPTPTQAPSALPAPAPNTAVRASLHPWQASAPNSGAEAYFTNLQEGAKIETPFRATFGLAGGWGLAPITSPATGKSGHHHLLVNRELPLDFKQALPFNDQYIHFGKGQMETVLMLEPGSYSLRLLLADDKHIPRFVYSKPLNITVTRKNKNIDPKSLTPKGIALLNAPTGQKVKPPFKLQFQASGLNVAHLSQKAKDTGHFRLTITPEGKGKAAELDFVDGQTEAWLAPPPGSYGMKLDFVDNASPDKLLAESVSAPLRVQ